MFVSRCLLYFVVSLVSEGEKTPKANTNKRDKTLTTEEQTPSNKGFVNKWKREGVQWETKGYKTLRKAGTPSNKGTREGVQCETRGDETLAKANTPSKEGMQEKGIKGDKGRQDRREARHTIQQRETTRVQGYNGRCRGGHTIKQRKTRRGTMGRRETRPLGRPTQNPRSGTM